MSRRAPLSPEPDADAERLKELFVCHAKMTQAEFGERFDIGNQGAVWQYLNGRRPLNINAAKKFARGLGVRIEDFSPSIAAAIREAEEMTGESVDDWPYPSIDEAKFRSVSPDQAAKIEGAILLLAAQLGVDVKK